MDPQALKFLYIHANCLAELGLVSLARDIVTKFAELPDEVPALGEDERERLALERLNAMDMSQMMNGFVWETPEHDAAVRSALHELQAKESDLDRSPEESCAATPWVPPLAEEMLNCLQDWDASDGPDLEAYLNKAYSALATSPSLDESMAQLDMARLEAILANLPEGMTPLTGALSGDELKQWLDCYMSENETLDELVTLICALSHKDAF